MFDARRAAQWVVGLGAGSAWAARRVMRTSAFYDEWTLVEQAIGRAPWQGAWASFNGHLWLFQDAVYRTQLLLGGVGTRWPVMVLQLAALAALHVAITRLAMVGGVPLPVALVLGLGVVYMGSAPQNWVFVVQWAAIASTALAVFGCAVVVAGPATRGRSAWVAASVLLAVLVESGAGTIGAAMVAGAAVVCWRRRAVPALLPAVVVLAVWYSLADLGPAYPATWWQQVRFGAALLVRAAGALLGLGAGTGVVVCAMSVLGIAWALRGGLLTAPGRGLVAGGSLGVLVAVAAISRARAGLPGFSFFDSNRYLFPVAVPLAVALLPVVVAAVRAAAGGDEVPSRGGRLSSNAWWTLVGAVLLVGAVAGQRVESRWSPSFVAANETVRAGVASTAALVRSGCPDGSIPDPDARPLGRWSPQITVRLVSELMERDLLAANPAVDASSDIAAAACPS